MHAPETTKEAVPAQTERAPATIYSPRTDVLEFDDRLELHVDLPGATADDVEVKFEENTLSIRAERAQDDRTWLHREFGGAQFRRAFTLGDGFDARGIEARLDQGVLVLTVPVSEETKPRRIKVR